MSWLSRVAALAALVLIVPVTGCGTVPAVAPGAASTAPGIVVSDAWVRATEGTVDPSMTGAFMVLSNQGDAEAELVGAGADVARMVQLHEMVMDGDKMMMQEVPGGIPIPAGGEQQLKPGGYHVMLMGLTRQLKVGDQVTVTLTFADGTTQQVTAPVKEFVEEEDHYHSPDDPSMTPAPSVDPTAAVARTVTVTLAGGKVDPSGERLELVKGDIVEFVVTSDRDEQLHVHGFEVVIPVKAGETVTRRVLLNQSGRFEVESHDPALLVVELVVR